MNSVRMASVGALLAVLPLACSGSTAQSASRSHAPRSGASSSASHVSADLATACAPATADVSSSYAASGGARRPRTARSALTRAERSTVADLAVWEQTGPRASDPNATVTICIYQGDFGPPMHGGPPLRGEPPRDQPNWNTISELVLPDGAVTLHAIGYVESAAQLPSDGEMLPPDTKAACANNGFPPTEVELQLIGGPDGQARPLPGTVTATASTGRACTVALGTSSAARLSLRTGTYTVTGRSPLFGDNKYECRAAEKVTFTRLDRNQPAPAMPLRIVQVVCPAK